MRDITSLKNELVQCECELASITRENNIDDISSYANYIDPIRAEFLKEKIKYIQAQIEIKNN